jgi:hypothetical protein
MKLTCLLIVSFNPDCNSKAEAFRLVLVALEARH